MFDLTLMLLVANLANTKWFKRGILGKLKGVRNYWWQSFVLKHRWPPAQGCSLQAWTTSPWRHRNRKNQSSFIFLPHPPRTDAIVRRWADLWRRVVMNWTVIGSELMWIKGWSKGVRPHKNPETWEAKHHLVVDLEGSTKVRKTLCMKNEISVKQLKV